MPIYNKFIFSLLQQLAALFLGHRIYIKKNKVKKGLFSRHHLT